MSGSEAGGGTGGAGGGDPAGYGPAADRAADPARPRIPFSGLADRLRTRNARPWHVQDGAAEAVRGRRARDGGKAGRTRMLEMITRKSCGNTEAAKRRSTLRRAIDEEPGRSVRQALRDGGPCACIEGRSCGRGGGEE